MPIEPTVIYNETCPICSREIAAYKARCETAGSDLRFQPIGADGAKAYGLSRDQAARRLHVQVDGELLSGVDAFVYLWKETPGFQWLGRLVALPGVRQIAHLVYEAILAPVLFWMHKRRERRANA